MSTSLNLDLSSPKVCDIILFKVQPYTHPSKYKQTHTQILSFFLYLSLSLSLSLSHTHKIPFFAKSDEIVLAKLH